MSFFWLCQIGLINFGTHMFETIPHDFHTNIEWFSELWPKKTVDPRVVHWQHVGHGNGSACFHGAESRVQIAEKKGWISIIGIEESIRIRFPLFSVSGKLTIKRLGFWFWETLLDCQKQIWLMKAPSFRVAAWPLILDADTLLGLVGYWGPAKGWTFSFRNLNF